MVQQQSHGRHDTETSALYLGCTKQYKQQFLWIYLLELGWRIHGKLPKWSGRLLVWCGELKIIGGDFLNVQMNEFPEGHVKVPSWELFILHIAKSSWPARGRLSGAILHATCQPSALWKRKLFQQTLVVCRSLSLKRLGADKELLEVCMLTVL